MVLNNNNNIDINNNKVSYSHISKQTNFDSIIVTHN